jgi:hypothetical protein
MFSASNVLQITPTGSSPVPANGVNPVSGIETSSTSTFVYYKFVNNARYTVAVAQGFTLDKLYYTIVGNGGLGGAKNNNAQPSQGSCGGGGGGGLVFPLNALATATPPINISGVRNFTVEINSSSQINVINYQDMNGFNISIQANRGNQGLNGITGTTTPGLPGATGGAGGNGGMNQASMISNTFASSGGFGGIGGAGVPPSGAPSSAAIIGPSGSRGSSLPSGSTSNGVTVTFADNSRADIGKPGVGGDNSSNPNNSTLGSGQGGEPGFVLLYYNYLDVKDLRQQSQN